jgi:hypothetical protein
MTGFEFGIPQSSRAFYNSKMPGGATHDRRGLNLRRLTCGGYAVELQTNISGARDDCDCDGLNGQASSMDFSGAIQSLDAKAGE